MLMIEERPVRNSVLVISRTIASKRCARTAISVGSRGPLPPRGRSARLPDPGSSELQSVVAELADVGGPAGVDDDRRLRLDHERRPLGDGAGARARRRGASASRPRRCPARKPRAGAVARARPAARRRSLPPPASWWRRSTRPFHWLSSIFCPGSRTAKIRSWASWKLSIRASREACPAHLRLRAGSGHPRPGRRSAPRRSSGAGRAVEPGRQLLLELRHPLGGGRRSSSPPPRSRSPASASHAER